MSASDNRKPEDIQRDIERTRAELTATVNELVDRLDPRTNIKNATDAAKDKVATTTATLKDKASAFAEAAKDKAVAFADSAKSTAVDASAKASAKASDFAHTAKAKVNDLADSAKEHLAGAGLGGGADGAGTYGADGAGAYGADGADFGGPCGCGCADADVEAVAEGAACGGAHHYDDAATGHGCSGRCSAGHFSAGGGAASHSFAGIPSAAQVAQDVIDDARRGEQTGLAVVAGLGVATLGAVTLLGSALFGRRRK
ncbi:DUF3618 domain-containing protein [Actinotignum schaalii]|uniref:DUF3618 domain-containing protein n=1 Tax=Actinotignum schaalii TaxID=59505 RepID=UPI0003F8E52C|nr:DUF3618 domain-containing protein [Actinotignum schaalii]AIE82849.1 hypothetical protein FB03_05810 [Actinotignum schaalii]WQN44973.1 DUF3618 domain-containing protein [Actinotignum schaalii]